VYDADTGERLWTESSEDAGNVTAVVSADPLVLIEGNARFVAYSDTGERLWEQDMAGDDGRRLVPRGVADGVLIATDAGDVEPRGVFAGYDLGSGERVWRRDLPDRTVLLGVDRDGGAALLGAYALGEGTMELTWLDAADGADRAAGTVPFEGVAGSVSIGAEAAFDADHFYLSNGGLEPESVLRAFDR
jgi:outer membrane protein assembly factor BamB